MNQQKALRRINHGLFVVLVVLALYIMLMPFFPAIGWWVKHDAPVIASAPPAKVDVSTVTVPSTNQLVIPALDLNRPIIEGAGEEALEKGVWRRPNGSTPDKGSNTVLAGHNFTYSNNVFYHLHRVKMDDQVMIYWQGKAYEYKVFSIRVVPPTEVSVEDPSDESILTMYTCTPMLSAKNRLVIQAKLITGAN